MSAETAYGSMKLYARKSSGLIRTVGAFGAMVFGVHCISLSSSGMIPFSWVASVWPGASIIGVLTIAAILSLFHGYTYAAIGAAMPRSGADYTLASRVLSPPLAFAASWTLVIFSGVVAGGLIAWIPNSALPALLQPMAILFKNPTFNDWAAFLTTFQGKFIVGTLVVVITYVTMLFPTRIIVRTLEVGFFLGLLGWASIYFSLLTAGGPQDFAAAWNRFMALVKNPAQAVCVFHVPPYNSQLDLAPALDADLRIEAHGGQVMMKPVGSTAVRQVIEAYQPLLTLHGHIHESPGFRKIGRSLCVNAGSEYAEGIMRAALINLDKDKVKGYLPVSA